MRRETEEYIDVLPEDRKAPFRALWQTVADNLQPGFEEIMAYRMPHFAVPKATYPPGYHCDPKIPLPFIGAGNFKGHIGLYPLCLYMSDDQMNWLTGEAERRGVNLDLGKGCIRFKKPDQIPLELVAEMVRRVSVDEFLTTYTSVLSSR